MSYLEKLRKTAQERRSIVCLGMDPVLEKIPLKEQSPEKKIVKFYTDIVDACEHIGAVKPNYAYFAQYGFPGLRALKKVMRHCKSKQLPVILDAKRGDIGTSSEAYAKEAFEFWKADAVTVSPYMGKDSIEPFLLRNTKGTYILVRTSNQGAEDLQGLEVEGGKKLFLKTAEKLVEWHSGGLGPGTLGAVVGATNIEELNAVVSLFRSSKKEVPLLIPGVGRQGGSAQEVAQALRNMGVELGTMRINSSSGISYAYQEKSTEDYADAAAAAVQKLNKEIGFL